jgi:uncharacterized protein (TIGR03643 family)
LHKEYAPSDCHFFSAHVDRDLPDTFPMNACHILRCPWYGSNSFHHLHSPVKLAMATQFSRRLLSLSAGDISAVIQMAWEDRTSFETIKERTGLSEPDVVRLMRHELVARLFRLWRARMKGRITKHRALRNPQMKFEDRLVADNRRANC